MNKLGFPGAGWARGSSPWLAILSFFLAVAVAVSVPLSTRPTEVLPDNADALGFSWAIAWVCHQLTRDPLHLLAANIFFPDPAPLAYGEPMVGEALLAWPLYALTGNDVLTFNLLFVATLTLSAFTMFLLAREITRDTAASILAGEIFAFTTANYDSAARIQIVSSEWTPLALFFLVRLLRGKRWRDAIGFGLAFALQGLSCQYYKLFFATLLALTLPLFLLAVARPRGRNIPWLALMVGGFLAVAPALPMDVAQYLHLRRISSERGLREGALPQSSYRQALPTSWWYPELGKRWISYDDRFFPGLLPIALTGVGVVLSAPSVRRRLKLEAPEGSQSWLLPFFAFGAAAFLFGCGRDLPLPGGSVPGPFQLLHYYVPGYSNTRVPSRFVMFLRAIMALFSAFGLSALFLRARERRPRILKLGAVAALALLLPLEHMSTPLPTWEIASGGRVPQVYGWLASQDEHAGLLEFPPHPTHFRRWESLWMHFSTYHWLRLVNGYWSYYPPFYEFVYDLLLDDFPGDRSLRILRTMGVRYVVFHPHRRGDREMDEAVERFDRRLEKLPRLKEQVELVRSFGDAVPALSGVSGRGNAFEMTLGGERVYRIVSSGKPRSRLETADWQKLPRHGWSCESDPANGTCRLAFDGDPKTAFSTEADQRPGNFLRVRFPQTLTLRGISLLCGRRAPEYARQPQVRVLVDGSWRTLPHRFDEADFVEQMLKRPEEAAMRLDFDAVSADGLEIRLDIGDRGASAWSVPELEVYG